VKLLILAQNYPYAARPLAATFNERSVTALQELCDDVAVLVPRPYAPPLLSSLVPRWQVQGCIPAYDVRHGIPVYRPAYLQLPRLGGAFCVDYMAFLGCRQTAKTMHHRLRFDAILAFDIVGVGGLAWRLGRTLGIPTGGWVTGNTPASPSYEKMVRRVLNNLDIVFYQSYDLLHKAALLLGITPSALFPEQHLVLPRGIPAPPSLPKKTLRHRIRKELGVAEDAILVLSIGRIYREKGIGELLQAVARATTRNAKILCVLVGSSPAFDETRMVHKTLDEIPHLRQHIKLLPACPADTVWEYLCAADVFAFTSYHEGMPNSLLEAMVMEVPAIAFAIPPVVELEAGTEGILLVPPFDTALFAEAIVHLAAAPEARSRIGTRARHTVMERFMVRQNMAIALDRLSQVGAIKKAGKSFS
jgi:glycosyltransferase involved in cell wall biosynthesis